MRITVSFTLGLTLALGASSAAAQNRLTPDAPRPIAAGESLWAEELTFMDVREAVRGGTTTIIIGTGGVEQNGPYVAGGKHNFVLQTVLPYIARAIGHALIAPIVKFVPEGDIEPTPTRAHAATRARSASRPRRSRRCSPTSAGATRRTASPTSSCSATAAGTRPAWRTSPRR